MPPPSSDWFSANAPAASGDWFSQNAPVAPAAAPAARPSFADTMGAVSQEQQRESELQLTPGGRRAIRTMAPAVAAAFTGAAPEMGIAGSSAVAGALGATGSAAGQVMTGENPLTKENLEDTAETGAAMAATTAAAGGAGYAIGKGLQAVGIINPDVSAAPAASKFQPSLGVSSRDVQEYAAKNGISLTPWQATQTPASGAVQAIGERSIVGSKELSDAVQANAAKFLDSLNDFADRVDPQRMGATPEQAGASIKQAVETAKNIAHENASFAYKDLPSANVSAEPIAQAWLKVRGELPLGAEDQILAQVPRNMRGYVQDILSGKPEIAEIPSGDAIKLRSLFLDLGRTMEDELPSRAQGLFKQMASATDSAIQDSMGDADAGAKWRTANRGWRDYIEDFGNRQSPLNRILKTNDPAKITDMLLNRASVSDIDYLKTHDANGALEALRRQVVEDIANNRFNVGRDGLGGYPDSFLKALFGKDDVQELYTAAELGRRFKWQLNPGGTSNVLLATEQLEPTRFAVFPVGAKASMPRPATSYLNRLASPASRYLLPTAPLSAMLGTPQR